MFNQYFKATNGTCWHGIFGWGGLICVSLFREKTDKRVVPDDTEIRSRLDIKCHKHEFDFMLFYRIYESAFKSYTSCFHVK